MPTLNWIGKEAVVNHDKEVQFRLLKKIKSNSVGDNSENLIIRGDNLDALKALIPYYQGKIKCIYIDPPYNTGNENWIYNDKVNSPKIKKWLGTVVGKESEDLCRHDKWLCMMYPRLKLLRELLSEDGVIFVSIGNDELSGLNLILDDILGKNNFVSNIIWHKTDTNRKGSQLIKEKHEYVVCYLKNKLNYLNNWTINKTLSETIEFSNPDNDLRGLWFSANISSDKYKEGAKNCFIVLSPTNKIWKRKWFRSEKEIRDLIKENKIFFGNDGNNVPRLKIFKSEWEEQNTFVTSVWNDVGGFGNAKDELKLLFGKDFDLFQTPKPINLIKKIISFCTTSEDVILDSFAGSGTTGHAVMQLNKEDGGNRRFILIEMEDKVAKDVTAERIKRAIKKYDYVAGFEYCELDRPLFDENGFVNVDCSFEQLATYVYFTETNTNIDKKKINESYIGSFNDTDYHLIFEERNKNVLTKDFLKKLSPAKTKKVIYADKCLVDELILEKHNIIFKQIPYEIKVF